MTRIIAVASIKGGVGKTTITENLGIIFEKFGRKVLLIDADIATSGLTTLLGMIDREPNLHDLLSGGGSIARATHGAYGMHVLPSGPSLGGLVRADPDRLVGIVEQIKRKYDYILIDTPPGLSKYSLAPLKLANEILLIVTQDPAAIGAAKKLQDAAQTLGIKISCVVVNRFRKASFFRRRHLLSEEQIKENLKTETIVNIPEDIAMVEATNLKKPIVLWKPNSAAANAIRSLAFRLGT